MIRKLWLFCLSFGLIASSVQAATITGFVRDQETREGLAFVSVLLRGIAFNGAEIRRGVATDDDGRYTLPNIPAGAYGIRFLYIGYEDQADSVSVVDNIEYRRDVGLKVAPIPVEQIVVEGERPRTDIDIQPSLIKISAEQMAGIPAIGESDPIRMLQLLPGVQSASDISSGLYIRGGGPDQTLVLLDQVPVYNPTHAFGFFSTFNADLVNDVTLYKGAYPANHGGRLGAVVDISSRETNTPSIVGKAGVSTIASRLLFEGPGPFNGGHWQVGARRTYLEPILNAIRTEDNEIPEYFFYDVNAKITTEKDEDWATFSFYNGLDDLRLDLDADSFLDLDWGNTLASASYNRLIGDNLLAKLQVSGSEYKSNTKVQIFTTEFDIKNKLRDVSLRGDIKWTRYASHHVNVGAQFSSFDFAYVETFNQERGIDFKAKPFEATLFVDDEWSIRKGTLLRSGVRARYLTDGERYFIEPRLSMVQALGRDFKLKLGGGVYNQYLQLVTTEGFSAGDFFLPIDETADPGRSYQAVAGIEWEPALEYKFTVEGYYTELANLVVLDNNTPADQTSFDAEDIFLTDGDGYATGVELFAERRMGAVTGWFGYTLGWTRRTFSELNQGNTFPPKYDRRHDIKGIAQYATGRWRWGASFVYGSGQAFTPASSIFQLRNPATDSQPRDGWVLAADRNSARLLPYHRLDVSATRDFSLFGLNAEWQLQVFNLYSRRNEWFVQYDTQDPKVDPKVVRMLPMIPSLGVRFEF